MSDFVKGIIQLIVVILFIAASFGISASLKSKKSSPERASEASRALFVDVQTVSPAPYRLQFNATGSVEARANVSISPQVSGRVIAVNDAVFAGGSFKAGEALYKIDPYDYELEVRRLKAEVARSSTAFTLEEAEGKAALAEWRLLNGDQKVPALVARKPQRAEAWANLKAAKAQLENAKLDLERTEFALPFNGRVLSSALAKGQYVVAGQNYGEVFDISTLEIKASLEDQQLKWLSASQTPDITITTNNMGSVSTYKGVLKRSAAALDPQTRFASVSFGFDANDQNADKLVPGVFVDIHVKGETVDDIAILPAQALQKNGAIWFMNDDDTLRRITPDILYNDGKSIALRGVEPNTRAVISRLSGATEGASVVIGNTQ